MLEDNNHKIMDLIEVGTNVKIINLTSQPQLNDTLGVIVAVEGDKYRVYLKEIDSEALLK